MQSQRRSYIHVHQLLYTPENDISSMINLKQKCLCLQSHLRSLHALFLLQCLNTATYVLVHCSIVHVKPICRVQQVCCHCLTYLLLQAVRILVLQLLFCCWIMHKLGQKIEVDSNAMHAWSTRVPTCISIGLHKKNGSIAAIALLMWCN